MAKKKAIPKPNEKFDLGGSHNRGRARMAALADSIGRKFGRSTVLPLNVAPVARIMRLPTGILDLDWKTGGGIVVGRINRIWGRKSTLKSTLCLRILVSAQNVCRHCKHTLVVLVGKQNKDGSLKRDCRCPNPRWWLADEDDYVWLNHKDAIEISYGRLPDNTTISSELGEDGGLRAFKVCEPPAHVSSKKPRQVVFAQMVRCEPMRCTYVDAEGSIDEAWARANGVDTSLVDVIGGNWAERCFTTVEESSLSREVDLTIIDSMSVLEPGKELEKGLTDAPKVAARAALASRFMRRHLAAASQDGLTARYTPTLVVVSQITTRGLGYGKTAFLGATDGNAVEHALSLDIYLREAGYTYNAAKTHAVWGKYEFTIKKNKAGGSPGTSGIIKYWLCEEPDHPIGDSDDLMTVIKYARTTGVLQEGTGKDKLVLTSPYVSEDQQSFSTIRACTQFLRENKTVYFDLRQRVLTALLDSSQQLIMAEAAS